MASSTAAKATNSDGNNIRNDQHYGERRWAVPGGRPPHNFMSNKNSSHYVSVGSWMWMMFVTAIPIVGVVMVFVWAFTGENESRKNYYRAILAWVLIFAALFVLLAMLGSLPDILKQMQSWTRKA